MGRKTTSMLLRVVLSVVVILTISNLVKMSINDFIPRSESNEINTPRRTQRDALTTTTTTTILESFSSDIPGRQGLPISDETADSTILIENNQSAPTPVPTKARNAVPPPYMQVTHIPSQRRRTDSLSGRSNNNTTCPNSSISLVVGYWAQPGSFVATTSTSMGTPGSSSTSTSTSFNHSSYEKPHPHRAEIEAAMVNNLHNPYIHQLVVILDSVSDEANCTHHFIPHMQRLSSLVQSKHPQYFEGGSNQQLLLPPCTLTCIDRVQGQPTYLEMFQYSSASQFVEGPVVIMANTDQAFDTSLKYAAHLQPNAISVISTAGFNRNLVPPILLEPYDTILIDRGTKPRLTENIVTVTSRCRKFGPDQRSSASWDAYLFERDIVARGLEEIVNKFAVLVRGKKKLLFVRGKTKKSYYMNENGAENTALYDLIKAVERLLPSPTRLHVWNSCKLIRSWHFHVEDKTHKQREDVSWSLVPGSRISSTLWCDPKMAQVVFDPAFHDTADVTNATRCPTRKEF